ncbi:MAG: type VI secretion system protein TssA [Planctomycetes bacterium]|nr:type VI secretion system protein TssA [Planctomycetota bacterium]MBL7038368.1 type VI secretion system protein TssA [Pirellulaceae bacterium]
MASPEILDFDRLLAAISDEEPAGPELKDDSEQMKVYYQIKDAREAARTAERQLAQAALYGDDEEVSSISPPDWKQVLDLGVDAIAEKSKDLWIASWLIEAAARRHGFAGLRDGFRLAREMSERFWEGIHPRPDEDGYATTVAQLAGLNGEDSEGALITPIDTIPITQGTTDRPLTSGDYKQAADLEQMSDPDRRAQRIEQGAISMQAFERAANETPPEFFHNLHEDIQQCIDEFAKLEEVLDERCGKNEDGYSAAPPTSNIRNSLDECRGRVKSIARHVLDAGPDGAEVESGDLATVPGETQVAVGAGKVVTREDAFRALLQVADFFRRTEPHSPVSYALEQAVRWGRMPLPELMADLIADESTREEMYRRVGIPKPNSSEND